MILLHGTTRMRAELIVKNGPDPCYGEGGLRLRHGDFSCYTEGSTSHYLGLPEDYAQRKAANYPTEGDPVILAIDVPDWIIQLTDAAYLPVEDGIIQFDFKAGFEELFQAWPTLTKEIRSMS